MWALLWNAWIFGHKTKIDKELDFCMATDKIDLWNENYIYHNAGIFEGMDEFFNKCRYNGREPFLDKLPMPLEFCSSEYVKAIKRVRNY